MRLAHLFSIPGLALALVVSMALPALSANISVTTTDDSVEDDGECSLREAVTAANTNAAFGGCEAGDPGLDTIELGSETYSLTRQPIDEDANDGGDLDITESLVLAGVKAKRTIIENGLGDSKVDGDGDRILHVSPGDEDGEVDLEVRNLTLRNGDYSCDGLDCYPGSSGIWDEGEGDMTLESVILTENTLSCTGVDCGCTFQGEEDGCDPSSIGAAVLKLDGEVGVMREVEVTDNRAFCMDDRCGVGSIVEFHLDSITIEDSEFSRNELFCEGIECNLDEIVDASGETDVSIVRSRFNRNSVECNGRDCDSDEILVSGGDDSLHEDLELSENRQHCEGFSCNTGKVLDGPGNGVFENLEFRKNRQSCAGDECDTDEVFCSTADAVRDVELVKNYQFCEGDRCTLDYVFDSGASSDDAEFSDILINKNRAECEGEQCGSDSQRYFVSITGAAAITDLRVLKNRSECEGDECTTLPLIRFENLTQSASTSWTKGKVTKNRVKCKGDGCLASELIVTQGDTAIRMSKVKTRKNKILCKGDDCDSASILLADGVTTIEDSTIKKSRIECKGDDCGAAATITVANTSWFNETEIRSNRTDGDSPAVLVEASGTLALTNSKLKENKGKGDIGGIENAGTVVTLSGTKFSGNKPKKTDCVDVEAGTGCP